MKKFFQEFKEFAMRGSVVDLTIGIVVGGAFTKVINSLVNDLILPGFSVLIGSIDISQLTIEVPQVGTDTVVYINYGIFLNAIINFIIIALGVFVAIKAANKLKRNDKEEEAKEEKIKVREEVLLLREIRDSLKGKDQHGNSLPDKKIEE